MPNRMDMRIANGIEQAPRDLVARLALPVVDRRDHPVGFFEHVIRQVEPAIFQDIQLHAFQEGDAANLAGELIDGPPMLPQATRV